MYPPTYTIDLPINNPIWQQYPPTYRAKEMQQLATWFAEGASGCVIGLPGIGRGTFLNYLSHRPDILASYLPQSAIHIVIVPIDLNILPDRTLATFYRVILRAFHQVRHRFPPTLQQPISDFYRKTEASRDPFLPQSALLELLAWFQAQNIRVVCLLNRFNHFCEKATPQMGYTLRSIRDSFKRTLSYLVGLPYDITYLPNRATIGMLYHILDTRTCWLGSLSQTDVHDTITQHLQGANGSFTTKNVNQIATLIGGYGALIPPICHWWHTTQPQTPPNQWIQPLLKQPNITHRLTEIWHSLTQEEQYALYHLQQTQIQFASAIATNNTTQAKKEEKTLTEIAKQHHNTFNHLQNKGVCHTAKYSWQAFSPLFAHYISEVKIHGYGRIWQKKETGEYYQGRTPIANLTPLEQAVLKVFIQQPMVQLTYTDIIESAWPDDVLYKESVSNETLYQHIRGLRKKIEATPNRPAHIVNWRGKPEGGYQFFPEGRPS